MGIAIALLLMVAGSVAFHLLTPWRATPLASDWGRIDDTLAISFAVTGLFFVAICSFVAWSVWRYRHRPGARAAYHPEGPRLEAWLIGITTVGIVALLAPGLAVYARYVDPPREALALEALAQQWSWRFRFPGPDGHFGRTDVRFVGADNPFGLDPGDPRAADDLLVASAEVHLPLDRPVRVQLRSLDVLHDFYVPQFRARMNVVPGQSSWFWFTPTRAGRFEAMCAQLCGVGHARMMGHVVVEDAAAFAAWRARLPNFAALRAGAAGLAGGADPLVARGAALAAAKGCLACHSLDGSPTVGPTWQGLYGRLETMADGSRERVDDAYLRSFIRDPGARAVKGFPDVMPRIELSDEELDALVALIKSRAAP